MLVSPPDLCTHRIHFIFQSNRPGTALGQDCVTLLLMASPAGRAGGDWSGSGEHKASGLRTNMLDLPGQAHFSRHAKCGFVRGRESEQGTGSFEYCAGNWVPGRGLDSAFADASDGFDQRCDGVGGGIRSVHGLALGRAFILRRGWRRLSFCFRCYALAGWKDRSRDWTLYGMLYEVRGENLDAVYAGISEGTRSRTFSINCDS